MNNARAEREAPMPESSQARRDPATAATIVDVGVSPGASEEAELLVLKDPSPPARGVTLAQSAMVPSPLELLPRNRDADSEQKDDAEH